MQQRWELREVQGRLPNSQRRGCRPSSEQAVQGFTRALRGRDHREIYRWIVCVQPASYLRGIRQPTGCEGSGKITTVCVGGQGFGVTHDLGSGLSLAAGYAEKDTGKANLSLGATMSAPALA